jgi:hypothetical protein
MYKSTGASNPNGMNRIAKISKAHLSLEIGRRGHDHDRLSVGFTTTCAIIAYHY